MSFQGKDVDAIDRLASFTEDAAEFANKVAAALVVLIAALTAMSWTGFAASFAAYLKSVVLPWVRTTAQYLSAFAQLLKLASSRQKEVSGDTVYVSLPAGSWNPPTMPTTAIGAGPVLASPDTNVSRSDAGGGAGGGGARVSGPTTIVTDPGSGSTGATGGGGGASGPLGVTSGGLGGSTGGAIGGGGLKGPASADGGVPVTRGSGGLGGGAGAGSGGLEGAATSTPPLRDGDAPVSRSTAPLGGAAVGGGSGSGGTGAGGGLVDLGEDDGLNPALLAAPIGLGGLGAAALGAARKGSRQDDEGGTSPDSDDDDLTPLGANAPRLA